MHLMMTPSAVLLWVLLGTAFVSQVAATPFLDFADSVAAVEGCLNPLSVFDFDAECGLDQSGDFPGAAFNWPYSTSIAPTAPP